MIRDLEPGVGLGLLNARPVTLVSCGRERPNVLAVSWCTPVSHSPPLAMISIAPPRFSHDLIQSTGEFVINVPPSSWIEVIHRAGSSSGRTIDKWRELGLTGRACAAVSVPGIAGCIGWVECRVRDQVTAGDHTLFLGEVVAASVVSEAYDGHWTLTGPDELRPAVHLGGPVYGVMDRRQRIR